MRDYTFDDEFNSEDEGRGSKVLVVVLTVITVILACALGYIWYLNKENEMQLEERKKDLAASMEDLLSLQNAYSDLSSVNENISMQLDSSRIEVELLMTKLQHERQISNATIKQYQKELGTLRTIMKGYIIQIDSLQKENTKLTAVAAEARKEAAASRKASEDLSKQVSELSGKISANATLKAYGISVSAFNQSNKATDRSSRVSYLLTTMTLGENALAEKGSVVVYLRVLDPNGNTLVNGSQKTFQYNRETMTCSASREVDYQGDPVDLGIYLNNIPEYEKGVYTVEAYARGTFLGRAEIALR